MADVLNPVDIEREIRSCSDRIAKGVGICSATYRKYMEAAHAYDVAYARAYMGHDGAAHEKRYAAELATIEERQARDVADGAYRHADRTAKSLTEELRAWQSVGASVRTMYSVAGRGDGP